MVVDDLFRILVLVNEASTAAALADDANLLLPLVAWLIVSSTYP